MKFSKWVLAFSFLGLGLGVFFEQEAKAGLTKAELPGTYTLSLRDAYFQAVVEISADGTYIYNDLTMVHGLSSEPCTGTWTLNGDVFNGQLDCSNWGGPTEIAQEITLTGISLSEARKTTGQAVLVKNSLLGPSCIEMRLFRTN